MRIALIIEHFDATRGAAEHLAVWIARELAARGHELHVVCHDVSPRINRYRQATLRASFNADISFRAHPPAEVDHPGIHIHRLRGFRVNTALGFRRFGARARQWCRDNRPDVVHSFTVAFPGDLYHACAGVYAAMQHQALSTRSTAAAARLKRMLLRLPGKQHTLAVLERKALTASTRRRPRWSGPPRRILSLCTMITDQFRAFYPVAPDAIVQLPIPHIELPSEAHPPAPADDRAWFRGNYRLAADDRVALFIGHDFRRKGLRHAIEAIARTRSRWKLLVVGLGKAKEYIQLADALGLGSAGDGNARILFVGPTRHLDRLYPAADALLLPVFYDPFGLVAREALSHGLPIISTPFLGPSDLVQTHGVGTIVPSPKSVDALAAALDALPLEGSPERTALAARARSAARGVPADTYIAELLALYRALTKN